MKKITLILKSAFVLSLAISFGMLQDLQAATLYYHKFEGAVANPASATYSAAPDTLAANLSGSSWGVSGSNKWALNTGSSGNAIVTSSNISNGTYTLTFSIANGYSMSLSNYSTWLRRANNAPATCVIAVNGTTIQTIASVSSSSSGATYSSSISGLNSLTGTVTITLTLSNASGTGLFRVDNFALYGTISAITTPVITSLGASDVYNGSTLTITGNNFTGTSSVTVGGVAVSSFTVVSSSQINAIIGSSITSGAVVVSNSAGKDTSSSTVTYRGYITNSSTTYTAGGAWLGGVQPPAGSDITIAHVITVSGNNAINVPRNITILNGGSIITAGNAVASNSGTITINAGGAMTLGSNSSWTSSSNITNDGTISFNASLVSTLTLSSGTLTNNGTLTMGAGTIATGGTVSLTGATTFNNLTIAGATTLPAGAIINGNLTLNTGGSLVTNSPTYGPSATLTYGRTSSGTGLEWILDASIGSAGAPENVVVSSGTLTLNGSGTYYIDGNLTVSGTLVMGGSSEMQLKGNMSGGGTFTHGNRKVIFNGTSQTVSSSTTFYDIDVNSTSLTMSGTVNINRTMNISANTSMSTSGTLTIASSAATPSNLYGTLLNTGTISISNAGGLVMNSGSTYIHNAATSVTNIAGSNSIKNAGSTFIYRGSSALSTSVSISNRTFANLRFESTSGTWSPTPSGSTATTINGDLYIGSGVSLTGSTYTGTLTIAGNVVVDGIMPSSTPWNATLTGPLDSISGSGTIRFGTLGVSGNYELKANMSATTTTVTGTLNTNDKIVSGTTFTLGATGTLGIGHLQGIAASGNQGNIQTTNRTFPTTASYVYEGTASQSAGSGLPATVANLTVNNTGNGFNNMVTLTQTTTVTGTLNLIDGHFEAAGAVELIVANTAANAIIGHASMALANNSSYVEGNLRRKVTTGVYDFPLGTSQNYQLATITVNSNTNVDNILVSFDKFATGCGYNGNTPSFYAKPSNGSRSTLVDDMLNYGYYTVEPYDATNTLVTTPNISYDAQMLFNGHNNGVNGYANINSSYTLMKKPACGGAWGLYGGSFNTNNNQAQNSNSGAVALKLQGLVSFSQFGAGFSNGTILPLEMTHFIGEQVNGANQLSWTTLSEESTIKFVIERSENADDFTAIGEVAAKGARNSGADYSFLDEQAGTGIHYYRLKAVDVDGNVSYSEMIALGTKGAISNFNVYPNPAANEIHFAYQLLQANTQATLKVYSMTGALMHAETLNSSETNYTLDTHEFKNGLYLYEVLSEGRVLMTGKFDIAR